MRPWRDFEPEEREGLVREAQVLLDRMNLSAVTVFSVTSDVKAATGLVQEGQDCRLCILGFASIDQSQDLQKLAAFFPVSDLQVAVNLAEGPVPGEKGEVCAACVRCWSRCGKSPAEFVPGSDLAPLQALLHSVVEGSGGVLRVAEHQELWATSSAVRSLRCAQIEGFAEGAAKTGLGRFNVMDSAQWYRSEWQGKVLEARWPNGWRLPEVPLRLVEPASLEEWLELQEDLVGFVDPHLPFSEISAREVETTLLAQEEGCEIFYIRQLFSSEECQQLIALGLRTCQPSTSSAVEIPLPKAEHTALCSRLDSIAGKTLPALLWEAPAASSSVRRAAKLTAWLAGGAELAFPWLSGAPEPVSGDDRAAWARLLADANGPKSLTVSPKVGDAVLVLSAGRCGWHVQRPDPHGAWTVQKLTPEKLRQHWPLVLALLLVLLVPAEAAITCVKVKRWIEYVAICCCTCASILCSILVLFFLTNKTGSEDGDPWADFDPSSNSSDNATARLLSMLSTMSNYYLRRP
ncbi:unnamed protein product [Effrenium voratum]|nr:unnamed protein product [Effrenium voratum]